MRYRAFGRTGWQVSEIGFGGWQIGGQWGPVDDAASIRTLLHAFEAGINFVDTAELYGAGHSETVIGEALRQWRGGKIYVATKAQPTVWPSPDDPAPPMRGRFPDWHLRTHVEASLRRLGVSLSSRSMRFSRRSRAFSSASSRSLGGTTSVSRCVVIHLFSVDIPTPRSSAICLRESPLVSAIRTASLRNSSVLFVPMVDPLCCTLRDQRSGTKP